MNFSEQAIPQEPSCKRQVCVSARARAACLRSRCAIYQAALVTLVAPDIITRNLRATAASDTDIIPLAKHVGHNTRKTEILHIEQILLAEKAAYLGPALSRSVQTSRVRVGAAGCFPLPPFDQEFGGLQQKTSLHQASVFSRALAFGARPPPRSSKGARE